MLGCSSIYIFIRINFRFHWKISHFLWSAKYFFTAFNTSHWLKQSSLLTFFCLIIQTRGDNPEAGDYVNCLKRSFNLCKTELSCRKNQFWTINLVFFQRFSVLILVTYYYDKFILFPLVSRILLCKLKHRTPWAESVYSLQILYQVHLALLSKLASTGNY